MTPGMARAIVMATSGATGSIMAYGADRQHRLSSAVGGLAMGAVAGAQILGRSTSARTSRSVFNGVLRQRGLLLGQFGGMAAGAVGARILGVNPLIGMGLNGLGGAFAANMLRETKSPKAMDAFFNRVDNLGAKSTLGMVMNTGKLIAGDSFVDMKNGFKSLRKGWKI